MANNYYQFTGLVTVDKLTLVIKAILGPYLYEDTEPDTKQFIIARDEGDGELTWLTLLEGLSELGKYEPEHTTIEEALRKVAINIDAIDPMEHVLLDPTFRIPSKESDSYGYDDYLSWNEVFRILVALDDGHHISSIMVEGAYTCSRMRLFEFGGTAVFISERVKLDRETSMDTAYAEELDRALTESVDAATEVIGRRIMYLMREVRDPAMRLEIQHQLLEGTAWTEF